MQRMTGQQVFAHSHGYVSFFNVRYCNIGSDGYTVATKIIRQACINFFHSLYLRHNKS